MLAQPTSRIVLCMFDPTVTPMVAGLPVPMMQWLRVTLHLDTLILWRIPLSDGDWRKCSL
jgi:hypothetical protein